jgi:ribonuclease VapC
MVIDTSVLVAILLKEQGFEELVFKLAEAARQAFLDYGKGQHPAQLNFGDCFAYALAKSRGLPLLFKGNDFAQTDLSIA